MHSDEIMENRKKPHLKQQFEQIRDAFVKTITNNHPLINCDEIEPVMKGWVSFKSYLWMEEKEVDGKHYPKIAVQSDKKQEDLSV